MDGAPAPEALALVAAPLLERERPGSLLLVLAAFRSLFPQYADYEPTVALCGSPEPLPASLAEVTGCLYAIMHAHVDLVGFCVVWKMRRRPFGYGMFTGVLPAWQGRGVGSWAMRERQRVLQLDSPVLGYVIEVEKIHDSDGPNVRRVKERRIAFHTRNGAYELPLTYYCPTSPPLGNASLMHVEPDTVVMHMFFYPREPTYRLSKAETIDLLEGFYYDLYGLPCGSEYFTRTVQSLRALDTHEAS